MSLNNYTQTCKHSHVYINSNIWKFNLFCGKYGQLLGKPQFYSLAWRTRFVFLVGMSQICAAHRTSNENAGDLGSIPGLGRSPEEGNSYPPSVFWTGEFYALYDGIPW